MNFEAYKKIYTNKHRTDAEYRHRQKYMIFDHIYLNFKSIAWFKKNHNNYEKKCFENNSFIEVIVFEHSNPTIIFPLQQNSYMCC